MRVFCFETPLFRRYKENFHPKFARKLSGLSRNRHLISISVLLFSQSEKPTVWNFRVSGCVCINRDLTQQDGRMTIKCCARLARHFFVILPFWVFQPSSCIRSVIFFWLELGWLLGSPWSVQLGEDLWKLTQSLTPTTDLSCTFRVQSALCWLREDALRSLHNATNLTIFWTASKSIL